MVLEMLVLLAIQTPDMAARRRKSVKWKVIFWFSSFMELYCITLLFCCMASRICMTKPVLIYCFLSPQALNGKNMGILPKSGRCKKIIRVVKELLLDWFNNFFVREVGWYLKSKNLVFHPILLLDNATGNVQYLGFFHSNIKSSIWTRTPTNHSYSCLTSNHCKIEELLHLLNLVWYLECKWQGNLF